MGNRSLRNGKIKKEMLNFIKVVKNDPEFGSFELH